MEPKKIVINGVEYQGLEDLPQAVRKLFADTDQNGVPDCYSNVMEIPEPQRSQVLEKLQKLGGMISSVPLNPYAAEPRESQGNIYKLLIAAIGVVIFIAAAAIFIYLAVLPQK